ncbi:MAG: hypothetical protein IJV47_06075 [Candidatus Methanomethylophilaceae archaeon]|nr:hypothetical protein [Candidatus Methanomethylophilaceae archaeon]MBQ9690156.1 hypothetical protein [Candidatus Methanomethylophilaceae archaeon]MBR4202357.1 hypothetical protein [Candidatus Methanomethylophilaceae archaeon]MBR6911321.1 hypothetical protein [Candidatus Methanomethylophilaceae archaeon]
MDSMRPYPGNYAMGLLFVMSMHMLFNGISALLFPEIFDTGYIGGNVFQYVYIGIGVTEFVMMLLLIIRSGIAYRITLAVLIGLMLMNVYFLFDHDRAVFDLELQAVLAIASLILLLFPSVRDYYRNWSLGDIPKLDT